MEPENKFDKQTQESREHSDMLQSRASGSVVSNLAKINNTYPSMMVAPSFMSDA